MKLIKFRLIWILCGFSVGWCVVTDCRATAQTAVVDTLKLTNDEILLPPDTIGTAALQPEEPGAFFLDQFKRQFRFQDTFIFTDATKGNIARISSEKVREHITDEWEVTYDYLRNDSETKRKRLTVSQKTEFFKLPFTIMEYFRDPVVEVTNLSLRGGLTHTVPGGFRLDYGYGYKWDRKVQTDPVVKKLDSRFDVWSLKVQNKKSFGKVTLAEQLSTIVPRQVSDTEENRHEPVYDLRSSMSIALLDNLEGLIRFDWRYEKLSGREREDWINYTVTFGFTSIVGKQFGKDAGKKK